MGVKYPNIKVQLVGRDGNAFAVLANVEQALRHAQVPASEITQFMDEALSDDYDHLLQTCMRWVVVN
jgi:hypothetical protein